jgi:TATA-box binding protein (TBP) (component of TFIID and TFIIIB)
MFVGGPPCISKESLEDFKYEIFAPMPETLPWVEPRIHNLVARTQNRFTDSLLQSLGPAVQYLPGWSPWLTTAFEREFESLRGASLSISVLMFRSGSMSATGASSALTILLQMALVADELEHYTGSRVYCDWEDAEWQDDVVKTDLIVCETILPWRVSRDAVAAGPNTIRYIEKFPGVFLKMPYRRPGQKDLSVLIFDDRIIVAGAKTWKHACAVTSFVFHYLEQFRTD